MWLSPGTAVCVQQCCRQGLETQGRGRGQRVQFQGQGLDVQGRGLEN